MTSNKATSKITTIEKFNELTHRGNNADWHGDGFVVVEKNYVTTRRSGQEIFYIVWSEDNGEKFFGCNYTPHSKFLELPSETFEDLNIEQLMPKTTIRIDYVPFKE